MLDWPATVDRGTLAILRVHLVGPVAVTQVTLDVLGDWLPGWRYAPVDARLWGSNAAPGGLVGGVVNVPGRYRWQLRATDVDGCTDATSPRPFVVP